MTSRIAVVTGDASGIGLGICHHLARRGDRVAVLDIDGEAADRAAEEVRGEGSEAFGCAVDVSDRPSVDSAFGKVRSEWGPIEILVTAAGIAEFVDFTGITIERWDRMIAVNLTGTFHCLQAAIPDMVAGAWGRIVTVSAFAGQMGSPRMGHYAASKGGVIALTKTLAREYGTRGITANTIPPFVVDTPMTQAALSLGNIPGPDELSSRIPAGRAGTVDDIGAMCAFLCSDEASYVTGQIVGVNGGAVT